MVWRGVHERHVPAHPLAAHNPASASSPPSLLPPPPPPPAPALRSPIIIIVGIYMKRRNVYDMHHTILGLLFSVLITGVLSDAIKDSVGRPRPNFFWRCFPDGVPKYDNITGGVLCDGIPSVIKEGNKSFPSGHSSYADQATPDAPDEQEKEIAAEGAWSEDQDPQGQATNYFPYLFSNQGSFAGLGFLSWYLAGKIKAFDRRGHVANLTVVLLPLLLAAMVAVWRVDDHWHHWLNVFAGGILGLVVASFCYLQFFPSPSGEQGLWPHAYFEHILMAEGGNQVQSRTTSNHHRRSLSGVPVAMEMRTRSSQALDSMEAGHEAR